MVGLPGVDPWVSAESITLAEMLGRHYGTGRVAEYHGRITDEVVNSVAIP